MSLYRAKHRTSLKCACLLWMQNLQKRPAPAKNCVGHAHFWSKLCLRYIFSYCYYCMDMYKSDKMNGSFVHLGCSWLNTPTSFFISSLKNQVTVCSVYLHKCQATKLGTGHSWTTRCFNDFELTETSFTLTTIDRYSQGKMKQYLNVQNCNATALMKRLYQLLWSFFSVAMLLPLS